MFLFRVDEKIALALPQHHLAEELTAVVRENLERLRPWMPWAVDDYSVDSANEFIARSLKALADEGRFEALILCDNKIAGCIGFHNRDKINRSAHVGYWIAGEYEGEGVVTRSCRVLMDYLFDTLQLNRVQINCNVENHRSRAIPERLNFKLEGIQRQVEFLHDRYGDWAVYAILREEWNAKN